MPWTIEQAGRAEQERITQLLAESGLPTEDLAGSRHENFLVARDGRTIVGCVGLESYGVIGLVRSLATSADYRGQGVASALLETLERRAAALSIGSIYGLTVTAEAFLTKRGYKRIDRTEIPEAIRATAEFRELCPETAICLRKMRV